LSIEKFHDSLDRRSSAERLPFFQRRGANDDVLQPDGE
jgi:hypothetical protein